MFDVLLFYIGVLLFQCMCALAGLFKLLLIVKTAAVVLSLLHGWLPLHMIGWNLRERMVSMGEDCSFLSVIFQFCQIKSSKKPTSPTPNFLVKNFHWHDSRTWFLNG